MNNKNNSVLENKISNTYKYLPPIPKEEKDIMSGWSIASGSPMVSILCPTYQHKLYIENAINSFLMQKTNFIFEIIIRDDASNDGTREIIEEYAEKYPNIIKLVLENENQYSKGIKPLGSILPLAEGKYVALCEGDDFWADENKLQQQVSFLEENNDFVITYSDAIVIDENKNIERHSLLGNRKKDYNSKELILSASIPTLTRCFRNVVKTLPKEYDYVKNGDTFLISLLSEFGGAKYLEGVNKSVYRRHSGGIWAGIDDLNKNCMLGTTFYWLSMYYKRMGLNIVADKYAQNSLLKFSEPLNISKKSAVKLFFFNFSPRIYSKLISFLNIVLNK